MIAELGAFALLLALALSLAQGGLSAWGVARRSTALQGAGEGAAAGAFLAILIAFLALMTAFVRSDFSVANVAAPSPAPCRAVERLATPQADSPPWASDRAKASKSANAPSSAIMAGSPAFADLSPQPPRPAAIRLTSSAP